MISVITIYNNRDTLRNYLLKGLDTQDEEFELITLENVGNMRFESAAEGLNHGASLSNGSILVFVHQDVRFLSSDCLRRIRYFLSNVGDLGVLGVAGRSEVDGQSLGNLLHGTPPELSTEEPVDGPHLVQTVDECLFAVPRRVFAKLQLDPKTCPGWHLYAVDYCLSVQKLGYKVYTAPLGNIYHRSRGIIELLGDTRKLWREIMLYGRALRRLFKKHSGVKRIYTTCGVWDTSLPPSFNIGLHALCLLSQGGYLKKAYRVWQKLLSRHRYLSPTLLRYLVEICTYVRKLEKVKELLKKYCEMDGKWPPADFQPILSAYIRLGRPQEFRRIEEEGFKRLKEAQQRGFRSLSDVLICYAMASILESDGKLQEAFNIFNHLLRAVDIYFEKWGSMYPQDLKAGMLFHMAEIKLKMGNKEEALKYYKMAVDNNPVHLKASRRLKSLLSSMTT